MCQNSATVKSILIAGERERVSLCSLIIYTLHSFFSTSNSIKWLRAFHSFSYRITYHILLWSPWANYLCYLSKFKTVPLSAVVSWHFSQIDTTLLHPIHLQSSSHRAPRGPSTVLIRSPTPHHIHPDFQHGSSLLRHHQCLDSIRGLFCSSHGIATSLRWRHNGVQLPKIPHFHYEHSQINEFEHS